jgi:hypothetical protein
VVSSAWVAPAKWGKTMKTVPMMISEDVFIKCLVLDVSPNRVPTVSKRAVQVQPKFRRDAFIFERVELRRAARSLREETGKKPGDVLPRIHPNAGANSDAVENGFGGVWASRVSRRSATRQRLRP